MHLSTYPTFAWLYCQRIGSRKKYILMKTLILTHYNYIIFYTFMKEGHSVVFRKRSKKTYPFLLFLSRCPFLIPECLACTILWLGLFDLQQINKNKHLYNKTSWDEVVNKIKLHERNNRLYVLDENSIIAWNEFELKNVMCFMYQCYRLTSETYLGCFIIACI